MHSCLCFGKPQGGFFINVLKYTFRPGLFYYDGYINPSKYSKCPFAAGDTKCTNTNGWALYKQQSCLFSFVSDRCLVIIHIHTQQHPPSIFNYATAHQQQSPFGAERTTNENINMPEAASILHCTSSSSTAERCTLSTHTACLCIINTRDSILQRKEKD